jgi:hypothetical protein
MSVGVGLVVGHIFRAVKDAIKRTLRKATGESA